MYSNMAALDNGSDYRPQSMWAAILYIEARNTAGPRHSNLAPHKRCVH